MHELERTVARLAQAHQQRHAAQVEQAQEQASVETGIDEAFRPVIEERLRGLEQQVAEVKTRVNGLLFLLAGTVATEIIRRLVS
jgi:uncharacterized protein YceH (UPF0502 family)